MSITIVSPVGKPLYAASEDTPSHRSLASLDDARVAFLWGMHDLSVKFWPVLERTIEETYRPTAVIRHYKTDADDGVYRGNTWIPAPLEQIEAIARDADWVVCGVGACGSCTSAAARDAASVIAHGVPAVVLVHAHFEGLALAVLRQLGVSEPESVVVAYPTDHPAAETEGDLEAKAHTVAVRLTTLLTDRQPVSV